MAKKKKRKDKRKYRYTTGGRVDMRTGGRVKAQRGGLRTDHRARGPNLEVNLKPTPSVPPKNDEPVIGRPVEPPLRRVTPAPELVITSPGERGPALPDPVMRGGPVGPGVPFTPRSGKVPPPRKDRPTPPPSVPPKEPPPITPPPDVPPPDETPPPPPLDETPAETPMTSREIAEAAARGEVPEAAQLPDAVQIEEGTPQQTTTMAEPTTVGQRQAEPVGPEAVREAIVNTSAMPDERAAAEYNSFVSVKVDSI